MPDLFSGTQYVHAPKETLRLPSEMRTIYKKIWGWLILFACSLPLVALPQKDSVCLYFPKGYATWNPTYRDNDVTFKNLRSRLEKLRADSSSYLVELHISGNASPDGLTSANVKLSGKRAATILKLLRDYIFIPDSLLNVTANGIDWNGLGALVSQDIACPQQQEILHILQNTPEWIYDDQNRIIDGRKKQLMELQGGTPYRYMSEKFFPSLRNTTLIIRYDTTGADTAKVEETCDTPTQTVLDTQDSIPPMPTEQPTESVSDSIGQTTTPIPVSTDRTAEDLPLHRMAIKTNLLYDAILMPSLEVEYRIDDRWSVAVEGSVAWWKKDPQHKYYQIATIIPEGRYWFKTKKPWHGHYVGLFAGGSWYDLENGARGYKGEFYTTGISYGYMFPIGRSLSLETGIGVGFLHTVYEEYLPIDGHYVYQQTSRTNWIGPVKLKFALVWRLWDQNKQRGGSAR